ncbi:toll-like receptor 1 [Amblyomma americanum]
MSMWLRPRCKSKMEMCMKAGALLLWAVTTACGLSPPLNCPRIAPYATLLEPLKRCNVTVENGYVHAICTAFVGLKLSKDFILASYETLTREHLLVSEEPVDNDTPQNGTVCMSLRSVKIRKWDNFQPEVGQPYDRFLGVVDIKPGEFRIYTVLAYFHQMTLRTTFGEPPQAAVAVCRRTRADRSCNFDVYGFVDRYRYTFPPESELLKSFITFWNIHTLTIESVNVTLRDKVKKMPVNLFLILTITPLKQLSFYKCNFNNITHGDIPELKQLERLEFLHTPITKIHPLAFRENPGFRYASFIGTKLPKIPEAIFSLKRLDTLDMSDTNVPRGIEFQYCPGNCQQNSSVQRLIMSGTNLNSLPNRAFCGFPLLKTLELENCHITRLSGSPFQCLENLQNLSMAGNKIRTFGEENVKGLKKLVFLNLNKNRIVHFEGPQVFSTLISLTRLIITQNEIKELGLGAVEYAPIEELNLAYNKISKWKPPLFARMAKLRTLLLEYNELSAISDDMLHDINHVSYVNLSWNPWNCSRCQLKNLRSVLQKHPPLCINCFVCKQPEEHEGSLVHEVPSNEDDCVPPNPYIVYGVPALLSIMVASVLGYAVYRNRWYCMYALLYLKVAIKAYRRQTDAGRFLWDGFISYHTSDTEWVRDVLLPKLESAPMAFRLCVAERDFIPGLPITENICRAIAQSRVSLFVLSREFCRSHWCMFELSMAQHRLFEKDRLDGMVFIKKNDVEESEMSSALACLIKSRTYVQLPPDGSNEALNNLFWLQVQAALQQ